MSEAKPIVESAARWLAGRMPRTGTVLVEGGAAASTRLLAAMGEAGPLLGALTFTGLRVPGVNQGVWLPNTSARLETFFMAPELSAHREQVAFLPFTYSQIQRHLRSKTIAAAIFSVSPPDDHGLCSFGPTVDFLADLWRNIPLRIAHINSSIPRTVGTPGIPIGDLHVLVEEPQDLIEVDDGSPDAGTLSIAHHVAELVPDGATVQTGLGKIPGAVLRQLKQHRGLSVHSGLIGDGVLDLLEAGAIEGGEAITAGVAIGTKRLYNALPCSGMQFRPVSYTHQWDVIAALPKFVAINSAIEVDLFGQAYSEMGRNGWNSGTGGVTDFVRGSARSPDAIRIVALPSCSRGVSRIVGPNHGRGPVTMSRSDTDIVITEFGSADLRGLSHGGRAAAIMAIAHPEHRETLERHWRDGLTNEHRSD